jgi:hypothetical protein
MLLSISTRPRWIRYATRIRQRIRTTTLSGIVTITLERYSLCAGRSISIVSCLVAAGGILHLLESGAAPPLVPVSLIAAGKHVFRPAVGMLRRRHRRRFPLEVIHFAAANGLCGDRRFQGNVRRHQGVLPATNKCLPFFTSRLAQKSAQSRFGMARTWAHVSRTTSAGSADRVPFVAGPVVSISKAGCHPIAVTRAERTRTLMTNGDSRICLILYYAKCACSS